MDIVIDLLSDAQKHGSEAITTMIAVAALIGTVLRWRRGEDAQREHIEHLRGQIVQLQATNDTMGRTYLAQIGEMARSTAEERARDAALLAKNDLRLEDLEVGQRAVLESIHDVHTAVLEHDTRMVRRRGGRNAEAPQPDRGPAPPPL